MTELERELFQLLLVFVDQVDDDPRAGQWFDSRLLDRAKKLLAENKGKYYGTTTV